VATLLDALGVDDTIREPALTLARAWVAAASDAPEAEVERLLGLGSGRSRGPLPFRSGDPAAESAVVRAARIGLDAAERVRRAESAARALSASAGAPAARTVGAQVAVALLLAGRCDDALAAAGVLPVDPGVAPAAAVAAAAVRSLALGRLGRHAEAAGPARASAALASSFGIDEPLAQLALGRTEHDEQLLREAARSHPAIRAWALAELALLRAPDDRDTARALVDEAHALLADAADPGLPGAVAAEADRRLSSAARVQSRQESELSRAELRVLRLLPSRLTQREIASELYLSLNTVKTHACAIYRKLGVTSRPDAVRAARALNLV
jgi:LuxR family maltose regulon positive regulatory protein